jgi:chromosome segregation ATPase
MDRSVIYLGDLESTRDSHEHRREQDETWIEEMRRELREERRELEREKRKLERERFEFSVEMKAQTRRLESEKKLFDMKWSVLEEELRKLAEEKDYVARQRKYYEYVIDQESEEPTPQIATGEMFFVGVASEKTLKKRYKELVKIYHPDNLNGDDGTIQEINREYDRLIASMQENQ